MKPFTSAKMALIKRFTASNSRAPYRNKRIVKYAMPAPTPTKVSTTPISRSIANCTTIVATAAAVPPANSLGGSISSQSMAVRTSRQSAASSLTSSCSFAMTCGADLASLTKSSALLPNRSPNWLGSLRMSDSKPMLSHTPSIAAQPPASKPLPTAAAEVANDCWAHCGLKPCHSPRSQSVRSELKPS